MNNYLIFIIDSIKDAKILKILYPTAATITIRNSSKFNETAPRTKADPYWENASLDLGSTIIFVILAITVRMLPQKHYSPANLSIAWS